ncbi:MAG: ATP-binding protein [Clostridiales bacterium]|nr:ATP-binding protein [Clostridiaceae bacterium]NLX83977.1 ATP-binding protein [Clostridiales bacterium]
MSLTKTGYHERIIDDQISKQLEIFGAICIEGPKWCGKTWTALNHANSVSFIGSPEKNFQNRTMAQLSPGLVLEGSSPRLLDEWQEVPALWDAVRFAVDESRDKGRFILTGSSTPTHKGILHSGTGRISKIRMRPMSLFESGDSTGQVSLTELFSGNIREAKSEETSIHQVINLAIRGGWPDSIGMPSKSFSELPKAYLKSIVEEDIRRIDNTNRNQRKFAMLLHSLARNESTLAGNTTLMKDILEETGEDLNPNTVTEYLDVLRRLFILDEQPAFSPNLRSSVRIGKSAKKRFVDPSLAIAALGAGAERLLSDLHTFGFLFESMCIRDLRIYSEAIGAKLYHYRDETGREIDAIIELPDGRWGAIEIKLGAGQIDSAALELNRIKTFMETDGKAVAPQFLCVICGVTSFSYTREDGVMVVPITALKP